MIFTNSRSINKQNVSINNNFVYKMNKPPPRREIKKVAPVPKPEPAGPRNLWGPAIWYMLHTTAEKIKEESFSILKNDLFSHIISICSNLPCPNCSMHATTYLKKVDFSKINTKEDLKRMLFLFHNDVNKRLGKEEFTYSELNGKYSRGDYSKILNVFFKYFEDKHRTVHMLSNDMFTQRVSRKIRQWILNNRQHFDP